MHFYKSVSCLSSLAASNRHTLAFFPSSSSGLRIDLAFSFYRQLHFKHVRSKNFGEQCRSRVFGNQLKDKVGVLSRLNVVPKKSGLTALPVHCQKSFVTSIRLSRSKTFSTSEKVRSDTLVFSHANDAFYKVLSYFGIFQLGMWSYLSLFAFQQLKAVPIGLQDTSELPWYKKLLYKQGQYKNALSLLSLIVGGVVFFITFTYPRRVVKTLWLLKGGDSVKITTYSWLGRSRTFAAPLDHVSCMEARSGKGQHIPMKIKDNNFYFIIDKQGSFPKSDLFDFVVGLKRKF